MPSVAAIQSKVDAVMTKYLPQDRKVYKRVATVGSGDALIGRAIYSITDTLFTPQPVYNRITRYPVGPEAKGEMIAGEAVSTAATSYECTFSSSAITIADLENQNMTIVMKDSSGGEEVFRVMDYQASGMQGKDLVYLTYIESVAVA